MKRPFPTLAACAAAAALLLAAPRPGGAQELRDEIEGIVKEYLAKHPEELGEIVRGYLVKNPEVLREMLTELLKRRSPAGAAPSAPPVASAGPPAVDHAAAVKSNADLLFGSTHQVTLGNPKGDVTLVEFFDYNCGFCRRALADTLTLIKDDPGLRVVLKEFPILGPPSAEAARVAVAVRMQDADGSRYLAFHQKLLGEGGQANRDTALAAAKLLGLDLVRLEADMASEEARLTVEENLKLASALGVNGTPSYVIGDDVMLGAVGQTALKAEVATARAKVR
jgi:protein-disulfide isomerase